MNERKGKLLGLIWYLSGKMQNGTNQKQTEVDALYVIRQRENIWIFEKPRKNAEIWWENRCLGEVNILLLQNKGNAENGCVFYCSLDRCLACLNSWKTTRALAMLLIWRINVREGHLVPGFNWTWSCVSFGEGGGISSPNGLPVNGKLTKHSISFQSFKAELIIVNDPEYTLVLKSWRRISLNQAEVNSALIWFSKYW